VRVIVVELRLSLSLAVQLGSRKLPVTPACSVQLEFVISCKAKFLTDYDRCIVMKCSSGEVTSGFFCPTLYNQNY
jgi:hypothetical protein